MLFILSKFIFFLPSSFYFDLFEYGVKISKWKQRLREGMILQHRRCRRRRRIGDAQTLFQIEAGERKKNRQKSDLCEYSTAE